MQIRLISMITGSGTSTPKTGDGHGLFLKKYTLNLEALSSYLGRVVQPSLRLKVRNPCTASYKDPRKQTELLSGTRIRGGIFEHL